MSTRLVLSAVGAGIGGLIGGPAGAQYGWAIGGIVGGIVDPEKIYGPKLSDARTQTARDGMPIPIVYGTAAVSGSIIWAGPLVEGDEVESGKGGPEVHTPTYSRSYAIMICEGPIIGVRKVWQDDKLVYDATAGGAIEDKAASEFFAQNVTFYLGDETQTADPTIEAIEGVGNVPAHRGTAYMVMELDDLTKRAASIPSYRFEVVTAGTSNDNEVTELSPPLTGKFYNQDWPIGDERGYTFEGGLNGEVIFRDTVAEIIDYFSQDGFVYDKYLGWSAIPASDGGFGTTYFNQVADQPNVEVQSHVGVTLIYSFDIPIRFVAIDQATNEACLLYQTPTSTNPWSCDRLGRLFRFTPLQNAVFTVQKSCTNRDQVDGFYPVIEYANPLYIEVRPKVYCPVPDVRPVGTGPSIVPGSSGFEIDDDGNINFFRDWELDEAITQDYLALQVVGDSSGSGSREWVTGPIIYASSPENTQENWEAWYATAVANGEIASGLTYGVDYPDICYDACVAEYSYQDVTSNTITLASIVSDLCARSGLDPTDIDVTQLTDEVAGFVVGRATTASDAIQPLMPAYLFDAGEWDGKINFVKRGGSAVKTLTVDDLVQTDGPRWVETRAQEAEYPRKLNVIYMSPETNYIPTKQTAERRSSNVSAVGEVSVELPIVFANGSDEAAQVADKLTKSMWNDLLGTVDMSISYEHSELTATDVILFDSGSRVTRLRIEKADEAGGVIKLKCRQERASAYQSSVVGVDPTGDPDGGGVGGGPVGPTRFVVIDASPLRQADDTLGVYVAACGVLNGWRGCSVLYSIDNGVTWVEAGQIRSQATMGTLTAPLPVSTSHSFDDDNTVSVSMYNGTLSTITDAQFLSQGNRIAIGPEGDSNGYSLSEILQYRDATATGSGTYDLDHLLRYRQGTEAIQSTHPTGRALVHLAQGEQLSNGILYVQIPASGYARTQPNVQIKCVSLGTAEADNAYIRRSLSYPASMIEWSPQFVRGRINSDDSVFVSWIGRGRFGNPRTPIPSQSFAGYEVRLSQYPAPGFSTDSYWLKKTVTDSSVTFTASEISNSSAGSTQSSYYVHILPKNALTGISLRHYASGLLVEGEAEVGPGPIFTDGFD